ncbi:MAG: transposase [Chitinophagales bacterium]
MNNKCTYNFSSSNYKQTKKNIASDSILFSYKSSSYVNLKNYFEENIQTISEELKSKIDLKWINVNISNLKRFLLGIYHVVKERYLQEYLNEFAFKLNRRNYTNKFDNLLLNLI